MPLWKDPKTGKYRYQFQHQGRRYSKTGFDNQKAVKRAMEKHREELEAPLPTAPSPPTPSASDSGTLDLETLMVKYLRLAERSLASITLRYRKTVFRRFLAHLGNAAATRITTEQVENYLLTRPTNNQFNKERTEIMRLFSWAHRRYLVPFNPVHLVDKVSVERAQKRIPSPQGMAQILMAAGKTGPCSWCSFIPWAGLMRFCDSKGRT